MNDKLSVCEHSFSIISIPSHRQGFEILAELLPSATYFLAKYNFRVFIPFPVPLNLFP